LTFLGYFPSPAISFSESTFPSFPFPSFIKYLNATERSDLDSAKHPHLRISTDEEKIISTKPVSENSLNSIRDNLERDFNRTEESDLHSTKHSSLKNSTVEGIIIRIKSVLQNVRFPIRDNFGINTEKQTSPTRRITKSDDCYLADNLTNGGAAKHSYDHVPNHLKCVLSYPSHACRLGRRMFHWTRFHSISRGNRT
jgi:hypothetical protein